MKNIHRKFDAGDASAEPKTPHYFPHGEMKSIRESIDKACRRLEARPSKTLKIILKP